MILTDAELEQLHAAKVSFENTSLATRLTAMIGTPVEKGFELLPENWQSSLSNATNRALMTALRTALATMENTPGLASSRWAHKGMAAASGAVGGAIGFSALLLELPISTSIMLRSIADIARENGEDISSPETRLSCLQVFALGGASATDDAFETGYFAVRASLARAVAEAAAYVAEKGVAIEGSPAIVRLIGKISARFSIPVSHKAAAQAVPLIGAMGGALINTLFIDHFQNISQGHFTVRRLERKYGPEPVQLAYSQLPSR